MNIGWVRSVVLLIGMLPVALAGFGVREGSLIAALQPYGVTAAQAVALSFLLFGRDLLSAAVGGLAEARSFLRRPGRSHDAP